MTQEAVDVGSLRAIRRADDADALALATFGQVEALLTSLDPEESCGVNKAYLNEALGIRGRRDQDRQGKR